MTLWRYLIFLIAAVLLWALVIRYLAGRLFSLLPLSRIQRWAIYATLAALYLVVGGMRRIDRYERFGTLEDLLVILYTALVFVALLVTFTLLRDLGWFALRAIDALLRRLRHRGLLPQAPAERRTLLARTALPILGLALFGIFFGYLQAMTTPQARHVTIASPRVPAGLDGYRILMVSDLHVGPTLRRTWVERLVERLNGYERDVTVIVGDITDGPWSRVGPMLTPLARLKGPVYFVPGNHEIYWHFPSWRKNLEALGIRVLTERHEVLHRRGAKLVLAGITDVFSWSGGSTHSTGNAAVALAGAPRDAYRILLGHRPTTAKSALAAGYDLLLSGHTHGGQTFPFSVLTRLFSRHGHGLSHEGTLTVFTTRGAGFWGPPVRLLTPPEFVLLTLRSR